ncbi:antibiotic biosynthesis monooxygenase family protein [Allosaccharopolyspora coralli]|uniref:antibiotic biosynthesis monooxygenase family protein n=1 Tax=Allosaccharopolyspora coralli TaxID=2665642 RepID=UPI001651EB9C|nr:antibiotic biosynthesis monooxygenase [Allosaccharopolyspora coralli]
MLLLCRFDVTEAEVDEFVDSADRALALLTARDGCLGGELARAIEEPATWVLTIRFESVVAYRRALSGFEVREHVIPLLSRARVDVQSAHETALTAEGGATHRHTSLLAKDAGTVRLGEAAGPADPR